MNSSPYVLPKPGGRIGFFGVSATGREGSMQNTGNLVHGFAARHVLGQYVDLSKDRIDDEAAERLRHELTHVAFVAATTLPFQDNGASAPGLLQLAGAIERLQLPLVVFGLGTQASLDSVVSDAAVGPEARRLLSVLSHHSNTIGVRGEFTADLCRSLGVHNVEVVGCQSCFMSCRPDFQMATPPNSISVQNTVINVTKYILEAPLIREVMKGGGTFIGQSGHFEYWLQKNAADGAELEGLPATAAERLSPLLNKAFRAGHLDYSEYREWVKSRFYQFYSMEPWFAQLKTGYDACLGTRFHGNMASMQMGVPSLWIVHDSRTKEFCEYLGLPNAPLSEVTSGRSVADLFSEHYETDTFAKKYPENYRRFYDYLNGNGVEHRLAPPSLS